jgi:hypothetical protein
MSPHSSNFFIIMKINYLKNNISILVISLGFLMVSCGSYFEAIKAICYCKKPSIYSSYNQVDSLIKKQLNKEKINYVILYGSDTIYCSSPIYFNRERKLLPYKGCEIPSCKDSNFIFENEIPSLIEKDSIDLYNTIKNLTDKDSLSLDPSIFAKYKYVVLIDKIVALKLEKYSIENIRKKTDIDSVFFIFINKDLCEGTERVKEFRDSRDLKNNKISLKIRFKTK